MRIGNLNLEIRESREVMELALMYDVAAKFMEKKTHSSFYSFICTLG